MSEIERCSGTQFDPDVAGAFIEQHRRAARRSCATPASTSRSEQRATPLRGVLARAAALRAGARAAGAAARRAQARAGRRHGAVRRARAGRSRWAAARTPSTCSFPREALRERGVELVSHGPRRRRDLHAPGQLVVLSDPRSFARSLRRAPLRGRSHARRCAGSRRARRRRRALADSMIGLWVDAARPERVARSASTRETWPSSARSACASRAGSRCTASRSTSTTDLSLYDLIVPCGISAHGVTSIEALTGSRFAARQARRAFELLAEVLDAETADFVESSRDRHQLFSRRSARWPRANPCCRWPLRR